MRIRFGLYAAALACAALTATSGGARAAVQVLQLFAVLDGGNEAGLSGDLDGSGTATIMLGPAAGQLCFAILVRGIDKPTMAHIHEAAPGVSGPIIVTLVPPAAGNPGFSSGCVTGVPASVINQLRATPTKFYVNVHSMTKTNGAVRVSCFRADARSVGVSDGQKAKSGVFARDIARWAC